MVAVFNAAAAAAATAAVMITYLSQVLNLLTEGSQIPLVILLEFSCELDNL